MNEIYVTIYFHERDIFLWSWYYFSRSKNCLLWKWKFNTLSRNRRTYSTHSILKINFNVNIPFTPSFSKWSLISSIFKRNFVFIPHLLHTCYIFRPHNMSWFVHPKSIWRRVQIMKFLMLFPPITSCSLSLLSKYSPQLLFSETSSIQILHLESEMKCHTHIRST